METKATINGSSFDENKKYGRTPLEVFKLKSIGHSANIVSNLTSKMTMIVIVAFFSFFLLLGLCLYIGHFVFHIQNAFFIIASLFLIFAIALIANKGKIIKGPMQHLIITSLLKEMEPVKNSSNAAKNIEFEEQLKPIYNIHGFPN